MNTERLTLSERIGAFKPDKIPPGDPTVEGKLTRVVGLTMEAVGFRASIGCQCEILLDNNTRLEAEVVGFSGNKLFLMPVKQITGIQAGARVIPRPAKRNFVIDQRLLGRVIDGLGMPLDGLGPIIGDDELTHLGTINPLDRAPIDHPLDVGIRAINALIPIGKGQRLGLFAGSGVGKSVLLGMMTRFASADIVIVALIGERGREVKEFIEHNLGKEGLKRSVVVASPTDESPLMRLRASQLASQIAEYYRDKGKNVLLLMDSLTRYAQAQREISLAIGEPPATKGYPPSVFAKIPQLVERAGNGKVGSGSITAFYTVLTEGDDLQDPVADAARAILDGHIVLSRKLAESGIYPAIDVEMSISRAMQVIAEPEQIKCLQYFKQLLANYQKNRDLVNIGAYVKGSDPNIDLALDYFPKLLTFIQQDLDEPVDYTKSITELNTLIEPVLIKG
ncbi:flagellar protein export ATPase FliI [Candidatus Endobugula sertula]|uniref:Flagellum-specific ATP synthase n=1 Tax=Candidatus Endobugula sertula TaxID=62101 RepID=A0A1D2QMB2_9GAMM|nr:flagellar protein export ATPase FliI [Candidatus Endobugula sertula]